jgi:hypothetical protein
MAFFDFVIAFSEPDPALAHHGYSFPLTGLKGGTLGWGWSARFAAALDVSPDCEVRSMPLAANELRLPWPTGKVHSAEGASLLRPTS